jgi:hypothetical protein
MKKLDRFKYLLKQSADPMVVKNKPVFADAELIIVQTVQIIRFNKQGLF